jgi:hypothetical protein
MLGSKMITFGPKSGGLDGAAELAAGDAAKNTETAKHPKVDRIIEVLFRSVCVLGIGWVLRRGE